MMIVESALVLLVIAVATYSIWKKPETNHK